jgi:hypothetical protein
MERWQLASILFKLMLEMHAYPSVVPELEAAPPKRMKSPILNLI